MIKEKINKVLNDVRPMLQMDGGDLEMIDFDEKSGILKVKLTGMCAHCPMSNITLKQGIEVEVKKKVSEVKEVVAI